MLDDNRIRIYSTPTKFNREPIRARQSFASDALPVGSSCRVVGLRHQPPGDIVDLHVGVLGFTTSDFSAKLLRTVEPKRAWVRPTPRGNTRRSRRAIARPNLHLVGLSQFGVPI